MVALSLSAVSFAERTRESAGPEMLCGDVEVRITVPRRFLEERRIPFEPARLRLGAHSTPEKSCAPKGHVAGGAAMVIVAGLQQCGTESNVRGEWLVYSNQLLLFPAVVPTSSASVIVRGATTVIPVECHYSRLDSSCANWMCRSSITGVLWTVYYRGLHRNFSLGSKTTSYASASKPSTSNRSLGNSWHSTEGDNALCECCDSDDCLTGEENRGHIVVTTQPGLLALVLVVLEWTRPGLPSPLRPICDLRVLNHFIKEVRDAEVAMKSCREGCSLSDSVTVPQTRVDFDVWEKKNALEQAKEVQSGLWLLQQALDSLRTSVSNTALHSHIDNSIRNLVSINAVLRSLNIQASFQNRTLRHCAIKVSFRGNVLACLCSQLLTSSGQH
ncbi:hypothetical protein F2P81_009580 [Scophthalmus maximus]|uniref:Erythropoietin n=1 Tax=Scophthalmus maximus TaxID=52904 RepID=A0A6A4SV37_SCOMX|nr:hypothetical protein F2P81_009580 [Scophthalmus maximus]